MLIKVNRVEFVNKMEKARKAIQKSPTRILECLKLDVLEDSLSITATSICMTVIAEMDVLSMDEPFSFVTEAAMLLSTVSKMQSSEITLEKKGPVIQIKGGRIKLDLPCLDEKTYPEIREVAGEIFQTRLEFLGAFVNEAGHALATTDSNRMMNSYSVEMSSEGSLKVSAIDGHRISIRSNMEGKPDAAMVCEGKLLKESCRLIDGEIMLKKNHDLAELSGKDIRIILMLESASFFNLDKFVEDTAKIKLKVNREELLHSVEMAVMIDPLVKITVSDTCLEIRNKKARGNLETSVEASALTDVKSFDIGLNGNYFLDALKSVKEDFITLELTDAKKPVLMRGADYYELVMPCNIG